MPPPTKKSFRKPASDADPAAHEPPAAPPKPKPRPSGEPKLSFDLDDEGESFQLKKRKRKPPPPAPPPDDDAALPGANSLFPARGVYTSEMMARLRASTVRLPYSGAPPDGAPPDDPPAALPELPDAEAIRAARAQRERARRQAEEAEAGGHVRAEAEAEEFIPLEKGGESRHVREEDEREEASVFDEEQQGGRLSFGPPPRDGVRSGAARREARFTAVMEVEEVEEDDAPLLLARGGALAGGAVEEGGEAAVPSHGPGSIEAISQLARELLTAKPGQTVEKLQAELRRLEEALAVQERDEAETQRLINEAAAECGTLEEQLQQQLKQFDFLQRAQAYTEDLLDCLNEKAASIEACERALCEAIEAHAAHARRHEELLLATARARAQASLPPHHFWRARPTPRHALAAPHAPPPPLPPECGAEGNAAAMAALHAAEEARRRGGEWVGWGSDEEAEGAAEGEARVARVVEEGQRLFADTAAEYCEVARVRRRFAEWRRVDEASYNDSYIELCLPTLLAPLVRTQMLRWQPVRSGSVEEQAWYKDCIAVSDADDQDGDLAEAERLLLAQLVCKVAMPRVEHAVKYSWRVHSQKQGSQLLQAVRELSAASDFLTRRAKRLASQGQEDEDETAAAQVAESSLRQLLMSVASRLEAAVADVCVPPCVAPPHADALAERVAADAAYSAWRSLKLLAAISAWAEFLSASALQDLAAELLSDHLIPYLRAHLASPAPRWRMLAAAVRQASSCLPLAWRRPDAGGGGAWSARLHTFLVNEAGPAFRRAHPAPPLPAEVDGAVEALCEAFVALQDAPHAESLRAAFEVQ